MDSATTRRLPCFLDKNDGLASLAEMRNHHHNHNSLISRRSSLKNLSSNSSMSSPRILPGGTRFYDSTRFEQPPPPHFLESCFLCNKPLGHNRDIFIYKGDTPFCSEECRQEQIDMDEAKEKKINLSSSIKALRKKDQTKSTSSPNKTTQEYPLCRGRVAAA